MTAETEHEVAPAAAQSSPVTEKRSDDASSSDNEAKDLKPTATGDGAEQVRTISRVPGNANYYEKDGLRTYGDGEDHDGKLKWNFKLVMCLVTMAFLWCGSQIPLYLFGGCITLVYLDIGGDDIYTWAPVGYMLALATVTPFVGAISDLIGRRSVAIVGSLLIVIGMAVGSTAKSMEPFIAGLILSGAGAGMCELIALSGAGELVPTRQRGFITGMIVCTILPFCPAVLYSQLIAQSSWRYNGLFSGLWSVVSIVLIVFFYKPPPRVNSSGLSRSDILKRIDYVGGFLSIAGLTLFLYALQTGGNQSPWNSAGVIAPLIVGILLMAVFVIYEWKFVKFPMFPRRLGRHPWNLTLILLITFISGGNFFAVLLFWPTMSYTIYNHNPIDVGVRSLPIGFGIILGSIICSVCVTALKGRIRVLLLVACSIMTAGTGAMAVARVDNMNQVYAPITFACLGVGAVIVPVQIIATIICPDDLIATATALTLCVRVIGGSIAYSVYYNVFKAAYTANAQTFYATELILNASIFEQDQIRTIAELAVFNEYPKLLQIPGLITSQAQYDAIVAGGQQTAAMSYPIVWYVSIAFGGGSILCSLFLKNIGKQMDNHVAVTIH